ncbi:MAG: GIY-YIG nuclease family protein [Candidatus Nanopelagicales bacterium]
MSTRISGVYAIFHLPSGRAYVGSALDIARRTKEHRRALDAGTHKCVALARLWAKDGSTAFSFRIISEAHPTYLVIAEQLAMNRFKASGQLLNKVAASRQQSIQDKEAAVSARFKLYYDTCLATGWRAWAQHWPILDYFAKKFAVRQATNKTMQFMSRIRA